jgi:hypothetical protein
LETPKLARSLPARQTRPRPPKARRCRVWPHPGPLIPAFSVIDGHVSGLGKVKHREFAMASGEMNTREFSQFLETVLMRLTEFSSDGSLHFICMDWRHMRELLRNPTGRSRTLRLVENQCRHG